MSMGKPPAPSDAARARARRGAGVGGARPPGTAVASLRYSPVRGCGCYRDGQVTEFLVNPRRSPRLPARCRVTVAHGGVGWVAETEDIGPAGCQIVSPRPLEVGAAARLVIESARIGGPLTVVGRVAWGAGDGRCRAGVSFSERQGAVDPAAWFRRLCGLHPELDAALRRVPDRLPFVTPLFLRPPPVHIFDFTREELGILRGLADGTTVGDVVLRGQMERAQAARVIFALLERRILTLSVGEAAPAWRWKAALAELEMQGKGLRRLEPVPDPSRPRAWIPPPVEKLLVSRQPRAASAQAAKAYAPEAKPAGAATAAQRPAEAQACFDRAVTAISAGEIAAGIALLRRALALSPRDPEVAALLAQTVARDAH